MKGRCFCPLLAGLMIALFLAPGCSSDPHKGGFFSGVYGLASGKYKQRVDQKKADVDSLSANQQALLQDRQRLEAQRGHTRGRIYSTKAEIRRVRYQLARLRKRLAGIKADTAQKQALKDQYLRQAADIERQIEAIKRNRQMGTAEKRRKLLMLKKKLKRINRSALTLM